MGIEKKGQYHRMWCTHNQNMDQPMQTCGCKLPYLWKQVHRNEPCIQLGPNKSNPNLDIYLLNLLNPPPYLPTNIIHDVILKPLQKVPNLTFIKSTKYLSHIKVLYNF